MKGNFNDNGKGQKDACGQIGCNDSRNNGKNDRDDQARQLNEGGETHTMNPDDDKDVLQNETGTRDEKANTEASVEREAVVASRVGVDVDGHGRHSDRLDEKVQVRMDYVVAVEARHVVREAGPHLPKGSKQ